MSDGFKLKILNVYASACVTLFYCIQYLHSADDRTSILVSLQTQLIKCSGFRWQNVTYIINFTAIE